MGKSIADTLDMAADLLTGPRAWTQGAFARNQLGFVTGLSGFNGAAVCWCTMGATAAVANEDAGAAADDFFAPLVGGDIASWNDTPGRTQDEVVAKLREAAALAREQGA